MNPLSMSFFFFFFYHDHVGESLTICITVYCSNRETRVYMNTFQHGDLLKHQVSWETLCVDKFVSFPHPPVPPHSCTAINEKPFSHLHMHTYGLFSQPAHTFSDTQKLSSSHTSLSQCTQSVWVNILIWSWKCSALIKRTCSPTWGMTL